MSNKLKPIRTFSGQLHNFEFLSTRKFQIFHHYEQECMQIRVVMIRSRQSQRLCTVELLYTVPVMGQLHVLYVSVESYKPERKRQDEID